MAKAGKYWWSLCDNVVLDVMFDLTSLEAGCGERGKGLKQFDDYHLSSHQNHRALINIIIIVSGPRNKTIS